MTDNFFQKFFEDSFLKFGSTISVIEVVDVIIVIFWSLVLSFLIAFTYRGTHRGVSYSQSFTQTLVLLGLIVSVIMLIVGTDIARAFTLVGALSIVRFRTALKETRDMGFIFFVMAVGMGCGTRFYLLSIIFTLVGCSLIYSMTYAKFGQKGLTQDILEFNFPVSMDYVEILSPIFVRYLKYYNLLGIDSVDENTNRISYIITFKKKEKSKAGLLSDLQKKTKTSDVKIIDGSNSIEI
ncbi:MAG: DUF4956 domain-containing protein [Promethearchaeota archaeon]